MTRSRVTAVLGRIYPQRSVTAVEPTAAGGRRDTAVVRFGSHPPVVVQFSPDPETVRTEAALVAAIRDRTSVPVPAVLSHGTHEGIVYLVSEHRPGTDLHTTFAASDPGTQRDLAAQFGRYLGELHAAFVFDGCGGLLPERRDDGGGDRLTAPGTECGRWLVDYGRRAVDRLPAEFDTHRTRLCDCVDAAAGETSTPTLFPWDLRPGNAVLADDEIAAVVDWGDPLAAAPSLAVAKTQHLVATWYESDPASHREAFETGYESVRPLPDVTTADRVAAVVASAVDSTGAVTRPRYPELTGGDAVAVHREWLDEWLEE
jgi:hypothetical protein